MKRDRIIFGLKIVAVWILLNIPVAFLIIGPLALLLGPKSMILEVFGVVINIFTFSVSLVLMFKTSKLGITEKFSSGLYGFYGLVFFQLWGLIGDLSIFSIFSRIIVVILGYLALKLFSDRKPFWA